MQRFLLTGIVVLVLSALMASLGCASQGAPGPAPAASSPPASKAASPSASAASSPSPSVDAAWKQVEEAAKKEGKVLYYGGSGEDDALKSIIPAFNKLYPGIEVQVINSSGSAAYSRIAAEGSSGQRLVSLISQGTTTMGTLKKEGLILDWRPPNAQFVDTRISAQVQGGTPIYVNFYGILVNGTMVKPGEITSWFDLLDPKWKGKKILLRNPSISGGGSSTFIQTYNSLGQEFHEKLAAQDPLIMDDSRAIEAAIARGEAPIQVPGQPKAETLQAGSPVTFVGPKEGVGFTAVSMGVIQDAPHPNAAKLFFNYLLSEEAQKLFEQNGIAPSRKGAATQPDLSVDKLTFMKYPTVTQEDQDLQKDKWYPLAKELYKIR